MLTPLTRDQNGVIHRSGPTALTTRRRLWVFLVPVAASLAVSSGDIAAQAVYPGKPVRLLSSAPAGGGGDSVLRPIGQQLSELLGQQVVIDNRPGAGGIVAAQTAAKAPPDGYPLIGSYASTFSIAPYLQKTPPYDAVEDFTPVSLYAISPLLLAVHPSLPAKTMKDLIAIAKKRPGELLYASNGKGSLSHLTTEMFSCAAGTCERSTPMGRGRWSAKFAETRCPSNWARASTTLRQFRLSEVFLRTTTRTGWLYVPPALRCISTRERVPILS